MKKISVFITAAAILLGCSKIEEIAPPVQDETLIEGVSSGNLPDVILASVEDDGQEAQTRTYVDGKRVKWHSGDAISYYAGEYGNVKYVMREGQADGTVNAEFVKAGDAQYIYGPENILSGFDKIPDFTLGVYPYYEDHMARYGNGSYSLNATYSTNQTYLPDSFGKNANLMIATGESPDDTDLYFRNACGYLVLKLYAENTKVRSIKLTALNDDVKVSGPALIIVEQDAAFRISMGTYASDHVTLDCSNGGQGVLLGTDADSATEFWFALPPITIEGGFEITITDIKGNEYTKQTTKDVVIHRNKVQPMAAIEALVAPLSSQIWYTRAAGETEIIDFGSDDPFEPGIKDHKFNEELGVFVIDFEGPLKKIKDGAFKDCPIVSIALPEGLETIGKEAFAGTSTTDVTIPLSSITIPGSVNLIDADAFTNCKHLESITFEPSKTNTPLSIECISYNAFNRGPFYLSGTIPFVANIDRDFNYIYEGEEFIPDHYEEALFSGITDVNFGPNVTTIIDWMFADTPLTEVTIPSNITHVGKMAFYMCSNLAEVTISSGVMSIYQDAFQACDGLSNIIIEDSDTPLSLSCMYTTGHYGPFSHSPLEYVYVGRNITYTDAGEDFSPDESDEGIFSMSDSIRDANEVTTQVTIGPKVTVINDYMFSNLLIESITIPSTVNSVGYSAFEQCIKLNNVLIEESNQSLPIGYQLYHSGLLTYEYGPFYDSPLESITLKRELVYKDKAGSDFTPDDWDEGIFANKHYDNTDLETTIELGSEVKTISKWMFSHVRMEEITIPASVTSIQDYAFQSCALLKNVICRGTQPPTMGNGVFDDCDLFSTSGRITVPSGCVSAYSSATNWSTYSNKIN